MLVIMSVLHIRNHRHGKEDCLPTLHDQQTNILKSCLSLFNLEVLPVFILCLLEMLPMKGLILCLLILPEF